MPRTRQQVKKESRNDNNTPRPADIERIQTLEKENASLKRFIGDSREAEERLKKKVKRLDEEHENRSSEVESLKEQVKDTHTRAIERFRKIKALNIDVQSLRSLDEEKDRKNKAMRQNFRARLNQERESREDLEDQLFEMKNKVAESTRLDGQLGDETIQNSIDQVYTGIDDFFRSLFSKQDLEIRISDPDLEESLLRWIPSLKDNTKEDRINLGVTAVGLALTSLVSHEGVFGFPCTEPIKAATQLWNSIKGNQRSEKTKATKQWLSLTDDLLLTANREAFEEAKEGVTRFVMTHISTILENTTTVRVTEDIREELADAILPCLEVLRKLHYQEQPYKVEMMPARCEGRAMFFESDKMEGMFREKEGFVKASLFPLVSRIDRKNDDTAESREVVVYKAKVVVVPYSK